MKKILLFFTLSAVSACVNNPASDETSIIGETPVTVSISMSDPSGTIGSDNTPTVTISGTEAGDVAKVFYDAGCSALAALAEADADTTSTNVTLPTLANGSYTFYGQVQTPTGFSDCVGPAAYTVDMSVPSVPNITSPTDGSVVGTTTTLQGTCEDGNTVHITGDISSDRDVTCDDGDFLANITFSGPNGAKIVTVTQSDSAGNTSASTSATYTLNASAISVTINQAASQPDPTNSQTISFTVVFSRAIDPTSFTLADITNSGTAIGVVGAAPTTSDNITWTVSTTAVGSDGTVVPSIAAGRVQDSIGNLNTSSTSTDHTVTFDSGVPSVTINQAGGQDDPTNDPNISFTIVFSEPIDPLTFDASDITNSGDAPGVTFNDPTTSNNITWTLTTSAVGGVGTIVPSISASAVKDSAGNDNEASTSTDNSVLFDATGPTVTINQSGGQFDPTNDPNISFTIVFSTAIDPLTFDASDIVDSGDTSGVTFNSPTTGDNITWTVTTSSIGSDGTVIPSIPAGAVKDLVGNDNVVSTSSDHRVTLDTTGPTVQIEQAFLQPDPTNNDAIGFTVTFNEPIDPLTFDASDITNSGTATGVVFGTPTTSDNVTWSISTTAITGDGTVIPTIAAAAVTDPLGNDSSVSFSIDNSVTFDETAPTVSISTPMDTIVESNAGGYSFTGACDEDGTTITITAPASVNGLTTTCSSSTFTFVGLDISSESDGFVSFTVSIADAVGNATTDTESAAKDASAPLFLSLSLSDPLSSPSNDTTPAVDVVGTFNIGDDISLYSDITCTTPLSDPTTAVIANSITVTTNTLPDNTYTIYVGGTDAVGNIGCDTTDFILYTVDTLPPSIANDALAVINNANKTSYSFTGTCSEDGQTVSLTSPIVDSTTCSSGTFSFSGLDVSGELDGTVTFTTSIMDSAGNPASDSDGVNKDTINPSIANGTLDTIMSTNASSYAFAGTCSENGQTILLLSPVLDFRTCILGSFTFSLVDLSGIADGTVTFTVQTTDAAGNIGTDSDDVTKDTIAPTTPTCDSVDEDATPTKSATTHWSAATDGGTGIGYYELSVGISSSAETAAWTGQGTNLDGQLTGISPNLLFKDGLGDPQDYISYVRAVDVAGNISGESSCSSWNLPKQYFTASGSRVRLASEAPSTVLNSATEKFFWYYGGYGIQNYITANGGFTNSLEVLEAGNYLLSLSVPIRNDDGNTVDAIAALKNTVYVNGVAIPDAIAANSFTRGDNGIANPTKTSNNMTILLRDLQEGDEIKIGSVNNGVDDTQALRSDGDSIFTVTLEYISDEEKYVAMTSDELVGGITDLNQAVATDYLWTADISNPAFDVEDNEITFNEAGDYLVALHVPYESATAIQAKIISDIFIDGDNLNEGMAMSANSGYIEGSPHTITSSTFSNVILNVAAGQKMTVSATGVGGAGAIGLVAGSHASLFIQKIDTSIGYYIASPTTAFDWNTLQNIPTDSPLVIDPSLYTAGPTTITINDNGAYMFYMTDNVTSGTTDYISPITKMTNSDFAGPFYGSICSSHTMMDPQPASSSCSSAFASPGVSPGVTLEWITDTNILGGSVLQSSNPRVTIRRIDE